MFSKVVGGASTNNDPSLFYSAMAAMSDASGCFPNAEAPEGATSSSECLCVPGYAPVDPSPATHAKSMQLKAGDLILST